VIDPADEWRHRETRRHWVAGVLALFGAATILVDLWLAVSIPVAAAGFLLFAGSVAMFTVPMVQRKWSGESEPGPLPPGPSERV
jgi:hypothetical protein